MTKKFHQLEKLLSRSPNPALGLRAIRLTLAYPKIFKKQLSAILRATLYGNIRIMLPMVSNVTELLETKNIIDEVIRDLKKKCEGEKTTYWRSYRDTCCGLDF